MVHHVKWNWRVFLSSIMLKLQTRFIFVGSSNWEMFFTGLVVHHLPHSISLFIHSLEWQIYMACVKHGQKWGSLLPCYTFLLGFLPFAWTFVSIKRNFMREIYTYLKYSGMIVADWLFFYLRVKGDWLLSVY